MRVTDETAWLSEQRIAALLDMDVLTMTKYLSNVFYSGRLEEFSVIWDFRITADNGMTMRVNSVIRKFRTTAGLEKKDEGTLRNFRIVQDRSLESNFDITPFLSYFIIHPS